MVYFKIYNRTYRFDELLAGSTVSFNRGSAGWGGDSKLCWGWVITPCRRKRGSWGCVVWLQTVQGLWKKIKSIFYAGSITLIEPITIHNFTIFIFNSNYIQQKQNSNNDRFHIFVLHVCNSIISVFFQPHILCIVVFIHFICLSLVCSTIFEHKNCVFANGMWTKKSIEFLLNVILT